MAYISPDIAEKIKKAAVLDEVISDFVLLKKSGSSLAGTCPNCGSKKKFSVNPQKGIWGCWMCEENGGDSVSYLMKMEGKTYPESIQYIAEKYNLDIKEEEQPAKKKKRSKQSFLQQQLRESGLAKKDLKYYLDEGNKQVQYDRFQKGTIDKKWNIDPSGDDLIIHYLGLDGKPIRYNKSAKGGGRRLFRVRWANPSLHKDKDGNPMKYKSPYQSGSHLYIPNAIIAAFKTSKQFENLIICEGEKKAEKLCRHGLFAVAVMGIHNFAAGGDMPHQFEQLIKECGIKNITFLMDSDWQDISAKPGKPVNTRPKTFFSAAQKFQNYFKAYKIAGIELELFLAHGLDKIHKGIDDVLVRDLKGNEEDLLKDFETAMLDREGKGRYINVYRITQMSSYKLRELWHLHSKQKFFNMHFDQLKQLKEFKFGMIEYRYNEEEDTFEQAQAIMPNEQYWAKWQKGETKEGKPIYNYKFSYVRMMEFLRNRGFGLYEHQQDEYRMIRLDGKVIEETSHQTIQRFVESFTREIEEWDVLEMIMRGKEQYLGPKKLTSMHAFRPAFTKSDKETKYLFFKNGYWRITADKIVQKPLNTLPNYIWRNQLIDFEPTYLGEPMLGIERVGKDWKISITDHAKESQIAEYYSRTSAFHWRNSQKLVADPDGEMRWAEREPEEMIPNTEEDIKIWKDNMVDKMISAGYMLHDYLDWSNLKSVVCMDGLESEVGKSEGGTGKSIWAKQFKYLVPTVVIDGQKRNLEEDNHLFEEVDERTEVIIFDDTRPNFNFQFLFAPITTGITVNPKGQKRRTYPPKKIIITTNHALNGKGNSFMRRQHSLSFSDYYNKYRTPAQDFGNLFFHEWDNEQWNYFYNWMATCIQAYLKFGLKSKKESNAVLEKRKLRQEMGENFLDWASLMYGKDGPLLNNKIEKKYALELYLREFSQDRKYINTRKLKEKLQLYSNYAELNYNAPTNGERIRSSGCEFFVLSDKNFDANRMRTITNDNNLTQNLPYS